MSVDGDDLTVWLQRLKSGDADAPAAILEQCLPSLLRYARRKLENRDVPRRAADEEDIALSAFQSFFEGAAAGDFSKLDHTSNLRSVLYTIAIRKITALERRHGRIKAGSGKVRGDSAVGWRTDDGDYVDGFAQLADSGYTPAFVVEAAESCEALMSALPDDTLRAVAIWRMEGYTNQEIATKLDWTIRKVERKVAKIRDIWAKELKVAEPGASQDDQSE